MKEKFILDFYVSQDPGLGDIIDVVKHLCLFLYTAVEYFV